MGRSPVSLSRNPLSFKSKVVEDLLKGGLGYTVFADVELSLVVLHHAEQVTNRVVVSAYLNLPGISVVLQYFKLLEFTLEEVQCSASLPFSELPSDELSGANWPSILHSLVVL